MKSNGRAWSRTSFVFFDFFDALDASYLLILFLGDREIHLESNAIAYMMWANIRLFYLMLGFIVIVTFLV